MSGIASVAKVHQGNRVLGLQSKLSMVFSKSSPLVSARTTRAIHRLQGIAVSNSFAFLILAELRPPPPHSMLCPVRFPLADGSMSYELGVVEGCD